jgi:hypothetical protein
MRSSKGNMLLLSCLLLALVCLALLVGLGFFIILSDQKRAQAQADEFNMDLATSLNSQNQIGIMNTLVEHCRELVYLSRGSYNQSSGFDNDAYTPLAEQLLDEAKSGAALLEKERRNQINLDVAKCLEQLKALHKKEKSNSFILGWSIENRIHIKEMNFGFKQGTLSNVISPPLLSQLHQHDLKQKYIEPQSNLFFGGINAKLPVPDDKLAFYLSPLPAKVEDTVSPVTLINPDNFVSTTTIFTDGKVTDKIPDQLPEALNVIVAKHITTDNKGNRIEIGARSAATVPGSLIDP